LIWALKTQQAFINNGKEIIGLYLEMDVIRLTVPVHLTMTTGTVLIMLHIDSYYNTNLRQIHTVNST